MGEAVTAAPDVEQRAIAAFLDRETAKIDALTWWLLEVALNPQNPGWLGRLARRLFWTAETHAMKRRIVEWLKASQLPERFSGRVKYRSEFRAVTDCGVRDVEAASAVA